MAVSQFVRDVDAVKAQNRLDLVLAARLFPDHVVAGPEKASVLCLGPGGNIDPFDLAVSEAPGQFAAVYPVGLACTLLVLRGHIGRIDNETLDALLLEPVMDPESRIAGFID
jgi:hypothetical protein